MDGVPVKIAVGSAGTMCLANVSHIASTSR